MSNVSPFIFPLYAGRYLFQRFVHRKGSAFGAWPLRWASPAIVAQFSSLFGL
jgi:hypothetical protein